MLNFSRNNHHDAQSMALRESLLEQMTRETEQFRVLMEQYSERDPSDHAVTELLCREIVALVDRVTAIEGWQSSLFLRNLMRPLTEAQEQAQAILDQSGQRTALETQVTELSTDEQLLYMTLYQAQGHDLSAWAMQLRSIKHTMLGRPIYDNEAAAQAGIRAKVDQSCDAYVVLRVKHSQVMAQSDASSSNDQAAASRLVTLEHGCLSAANIEHFVYMKKTYRLEQGKLVLQQTDNTGNL